MILKSLGSVRTKSCLSVNLLNFKPRLAKIVCLWAESLSEIYEKSSWLTVLISPSEQSSSSMFSRSMAHWIGVCSVSVFFFKTFFLFSRIRLLREISYFWQGDNRSSGVIYIGIFRAPYLNLGFVFEKSFGEFLEFFKSKTFSSELSTFDFKLVTYFSIKAFSKEF
jgi:hypothetical protein